MARRKRDYKKEYARDHSSPKAIADRTKRVQARRRAAKAGQVRKGDGKEVDHKRPLSKGGSNSRSNTRIVSRRANRSKGAKSK
jgi:5-methylcytosine-specific restriction endonuclease McrA